MFLFPDSERTQSLYTASYLYTPGSDILTAVTHSKQNLCLNIQDSEHIKFLMDISLQLTTTSDYPRLLAQAFNLEHYQLEEILHKSPNDAPWQVYGILRTGLAKHKGLCNEVTLGDLQDALSVKAVKLASESCLTKSDSPGVSLVPSELDTTPVQGGLLGGCTGDCFLVDLSEKLQCCWKKVGSLMGMGKALWRR